jgi:hypothetical protein
MTQLQDRTVGLSWTGICLLLFFIPWGIFPSDAGAGSRGISMVATDLPGRYANGGTYRALLIGNDAYAGDPGLWKPLKTAVAGAKALKQVLLKQYGFSDVQLLKNATRRDILLALQALSRRVMPNDSVLMYYAGHGYLNMDTQKGYWVPVDAKDTDNTTFLRNSTIRDELGIIASRAKHTLLISDACFSGSLLRGGSRGIAARTGTEAYYRKVADKRSIQVLTAGGVEYVDDDYHTSGHSPFTYFLLNELQHNDRLLLTASELSTNVEKAVANNVDQVPESGVVQGAGDEMGEFIFINIDLAVPGVPKEKVKVHVNVVDADTERSPKADSDFSVDLGVELLAGGWSGKNKASDTKWDGGGGQIGLNLSLNKGRFFTALDLHGGNYTFKDDAPEQVSSKGTSPQEDVKIAHNALDFALGYYFWRHLAFFLDLQSTNRKWGNNDYEMRYTGIGGGIRGDWPISSHWDLVGRLAVLPRTTVKGDDHEIGDVSGGGLELGAAFRPKPKHRFGIGLRLETRSYDFDAGGKQDDQMLGLFLNYAYRFGF